ncbi:MAG TPA: hypothetical protein VK674_06385 [Candidatus Limnocylindria bacterium]|nr:hypothetical protein [Candidatus Limnocylindria bacterium]
MKSGEIMEPEEIKLQLYGTIPRPGAYQLVGDLSTTGLDIKSAEELRASLKRTLEATIPERLAVLVLSEADLNVLSLHEDLTKVPSSRYGIQVFFSEE